MVVMMKYRRLQQIWCGGDGDKVKQPEAFKKMHNGG
jgi:hypothetical protein